jgi:hypothetical protein
VVFTHHGAPPCKLKKVRVVFDYSSEIKGRSLNKELIPSPDLTNQIVPTFKRFRSESIGIMADIESMYFQVIVKEED